MLKGLFKDTVIYGISSFVANGVGVFLIPFYTRVFSTAEYGIIDIIAVSTSFAIVLLSLQIEQAVARFYVDSESDTARVRVASTGLAFVVAVFLLFGAVGIVASPYLSRYGLEDESYTLVVVLAVANVFSFAIFSYAINMLKWRFESHKYALCSVGSVVVQASLIFFLVSSGWGLEGVFVGYGAANLLFALCGIWLGRSSYGFELEWKVLGKMLSFGWPLAVSAVPVYMMFYMDRFFVKEMIGLAELGVYGVAVRLASVITLLLAGFQMAWGPFVYQNYRNPEAPATFASVFRYVMGLGLLGFAALSLFGPEVLRVFATGNYVKGHVIVPWLIAGHLLWSIGGYFSMGIRIEKKTGLIAVVSVFGMLVNAAMNVLLIPLLGIVGAAVATFSSFLLVAILSIRLSQRYYRIPYEWGRVLFAAAASISAVIIGFGLEPVIKVESVLIKVLLCIGLVVFFVVIGIVRLDEVKHICRLRSLIGFGQR